MNLFVSPIAKAAAYIAEKAGGKTDRLIKLTVCKADVFDKVAKTVNAEKEIIKHIIKEGDTLEAGMVKAGMSLDDVLRSNVYWGDKSIRKMFKEEFGIGIFRAHWIRFKGYCASIAETCKGLWNKVSGKADDAAKTVAETTAKPAPAAVSTATNATAKTGTEAAKSTLSAEGKALREYVYANRQGLNASEAVGKFSTDNTYAALVKKAQESGKAYKTAAHAADPQTAYKAGKSAGNAEASLKLKAKQAEQVSVT
jgi:hypothetical protein